MIWSLSIARSLPDYGTDVVIGFCVFLEDILQNNGGLIKVEERVQEAINKVRPFLQRDGGDVELVEVAPDGLVKVRLKGACSG